MKLGSGFPEPEEIDNLTDLKQPQNIMGISSKIVENNVCEVTSVILTSNINTPFYAREWGLFAKDPDEGEILYMYTTDPNPDYIPDKNSALVISASYALNIAVLNVDNIVANIDPQGLITAGMLEEELKKYLPLSGGTLNGLLNLYSGSTVPTPDTDDNSTKIANTSFIQNLLTSKFELLGEENGWWREKNTGLIMQWCSENNFWDLNYSPEIHPDDIATLNFPITFNNILTVIPLVFTGQKTMSFCYGVKEFNNSMVKIQFQEIVSTQQKVKAGCLAIGV